MAVPAWSPGLTINNSNQIERVQKTALAIICGDEYESYSSALKKLKLETLYDRRRSLCLSFAKKAYTSDKFNHWFNENNSDQLMPLMDVKTRTSRFRKSPLPYITDLLNQELSK